MGQILGMNRVKQSNVVIKENLGKFDEVLQPGCHCIPWCCGSSVAGELSLQFLRVRCQTKTKDDVFITLIASVEYRVMQERTSMSFYGLSNTREHVQGHAVHDIRARVANLSMDEAYEKERDIAAAAKVNLKKVMLDYGIEIVHICIVDIEPDELTKRAMSEINAASQMRVAKNKMSHAEKIMKMKKAREEVEYEYIEELEQARHKEFIDKIHTKKFFNMTKEMDTTSSCVSSHR